jgi:hypothetical protein
MLRIMVGAALASMLAAGPAQAAEITGRYLEVRNCDVWTGPCFANAEGNLIGKHGAMVWHIEQGTIDDTPIDGLTVLAVIQASDTLGFKQTGPTKAVVIVDARATASQKEALLKFVRQQGGALLENVVAVEDATIRANMCACLGEGCAEVDAGVVKIKTRCLDEKHDKACGNESLLFQPLVKGIHAVAAVAEHRYSGGGLEQTWYESERRGAFVGSFTTGR